MKIKNKKTLIWVAAIVLALTVIWYLLPEDVKDKIQPTSSNNNVENLNDIKSIVNQLRQSNIYIQVHTGPEKEIYILYNKNKEAFAESHAGGLAVYRSDDKMISFGEEVSIEYGISPLRMIELAIQLVDKKVAILETPVDKESEKFTKLKTYTISITTKDNVRKLYEQIDKTYAELMIKEIFADNETDSKMIITIITGNNGELGASCVLEIEGESYTSWYFDGYLELFDWELPNDWYNNNPTDREYWKKLINDLVDDIENKTQQFANDNGINLDSIEPHEGELTEGLEHDHDGDGVNDH